MSSFGYGGWPKYVSVAERRKKAEREVAKLRKKGTCIEPITIEGRAITTTFWGKAWCETLEQYQDYENRLARGRTYVRNGSVVHLSIDEGSITALVAGSHLYTVTIQMSKLKEATWRALCADCTGSISSLVDLLQGKFSKGMMERLCRQEGGLFPKSSEIRFSCSCPDSASMCKHVAATLLGIGARFDKQPELLFRLRAVNEQDLLPDLNALTPLTATPISSAKRLETDDVAALFGIDMADQLDAVPEPTDAKARSKRKPPPLPKVQQKASSRKKASS